jgi:hypothetical protein
MSIEIMQERARIHKMLNNIKHNYKIEWTSPGVERFVCVLDYIQASRLTSDSCILRQLNAADLK